MKLFSMHQKFLFLAAVVFAATIFSSCYETSRLSVDLSIEIPETETRTVTSVSSVYEWNSRAKGTEFIKSSSNPNEYAVSIMESLFQSMYFQHEYIIRIGYNEEFTVDEEGRKKPVSGDYEYVSYFVNYNNFDKARHTRKIVYENKNGSQSPYKGSVSVLYLDYPYNNY